MFPFEHIIEIDKESKVPVYRQISISIINAIRNGNLGAGVHLPGTRELAKILGVHRKTVIAAYEELNAQDWILIIPRKQVTVSSRIPTLQPRKWDTADVPVPYKNDLKMPFRAISEVAVKDNIISTAEIIIDDGYPDIRISPIDDLLKTYRFYTSGRLHVKNTITGATQGTLQLREELVRYLSATRGLNISAENLLITHGAQMSIFLAAQLLLDHQSTVIIGIPNYSIANKAFEETGAHLIEVQVDEHGLNTGTIEAICQKQKVNAVYIIPHHHYPTTVTLSVERRMKLLELSNQYSFVIIEDDYDYDYHYTSSPYLPLASANHQGNIIYIGSFSKILGPSMRIGFMVAPENFIRQCTALRKVIDVSGDGYMQNALAELIRAGELSRHLKKAKKLYHQRRDYLDRLLRNKLSAFVHYTLPSGGMAIWIKLCPDISLKVLSSASQIWIKQIYPEENAFRFGFASMNEKEMDAAVELLEKILRKDSNYI